VADDEATSSRQVRDVALLPRQTLGAANLGKVSTLPELAIPRQHVEPLKTLADLPDDTFEQLLKEIEPEKPVQDRSTLIQQVTIGLGDNSKARRLVATLVSLYNVGIYSGWDLGVLAPAVANSPQLQDLTDSQRAKLTERIQGLFSNRTIATISSAGRVIFDHERVFHRARILTDVRPVFTTEGDVPSGAVLVYTLRVDSHKLGRDESLSFAMDDRDLERLKRVVDRAVEERASVKRLLESTGVMSFSPLEEE
jgi:hypothetical protein